MVRFVSKSIITSQTIGERFVKTRQGGGWTLGHIARQIGVKANYLAAIEAGQYIELPGDIYALEFVKAYARWLRLDEREVTREYLTERAVQCAVAAKQKVKFKIDFNWDWFRKHNLALGKTVLSLAIMAFVFYGAALARVAFLPPSLEVFSPAVYYEANGSLIVLSGQTEPGSSIFVNNEAIFTDESGAFNETINVPAGVNLFKIMAENKKGQQRIVYRTVKTQSTLGRALNPARPLEVAGIVAGANVKKEAKSGNN